MLSLVPSDTIAKHQFQLFFRVDPSCWEEVASFIPRQADFTFWINNNFELCHQIGPSTVASTLLIPTLISLKKMYSMIPQWMPINAKLISKARTPLGGYCQARNGLKTGRASFVYSWQVNVRQVFHTILSPTTNRPQGGKPHRLSTPSSPACVILINTGMGNPFLHWRARKDPSGAINIATGAAVLWSAACCLDGNTKVRPGSRMSAGRKCCTL